MLGQELVRFFKKDKELEVTAWDQEELDITKEKDVLKKISVLHPDVIINSAAYNAVDKCEEDKKEFELAKKINGIAPGYLAKAAKKNKAILVHYSSDYVFDGQPRIPEPAGCTHSCSTCALHDGFVPEVGFSEDDKPAPINNYGKSKLLGEKEVAKNTKEFYLIRTSKIFGKSAKGKNSKRSFFDTMLEVGKSASWRTPVGEVKVVDDETSCFTYAPDLAKKTKEIIDSKKPFGIYHVSNSGPCTWYEAAIYLYKIAKIKVKTIPVEGGAFPRPAKRPFYSVLVNTKLNPMRSWQEALKDYLGK